MDTAADDGTLTPDEWAELQRIADAYNTAIDVVGSRAAGRGRNIYTNLPVGKDPPGTPGATRSDIDLRVDGQAVIDSQGRLADELIEISGGAGNIHDSSLGVYPSYPPFIAFRPRRGEFHERGE